VERPDDHPAAEVYTIIGIMSNTAPGGKNTLTIEISGFVRIVRASIGICDGTETMGSEPGQGMSLAARAWQ
jgi:hypothetical protein